MTKSWLIVFFAVAAMLACQVAGAESGDINISITDSNNTSINLDLQTSEQSEVQNVSNYGDNETDGDQECQCPAVEIPSLVDGALFLPRVDVYDMDHGIWLMYRARIVFDAGGCVADVDLTPLGLVE